MVLDAEAVEGRLPTSLLGVGGATAKTQNQKKATTGRSAKEELTCHSPVACKAFALFRAASLCKNSYRPMLLRQVHVVAEIAANGCQSRLADKLFAQG